MASSFSFQIFQISVMNISFPYEHKTKDQTIFLLLISNNFLCHKMICHTDNMEKKSQVKVPWIFSYLKFIMHLHFSQKLHWAYLKVKIEIRKYVKDFICLLHQVVSWEKSTKNLSSEYLNFDFQMNKYQCLPVIVRKKP